MENDHIIIDTTGRRRIKVGKMDDNIYFEILLKDKHLATMEVTREEARKLERWLMHTLYGKQNNG